MSQKTYINGPLINEYVFNDGGSILKFSIAADKIDEFAAQLKSAAKDGWVRLSIQKNLKPMLSKKTGKPISTHSISVDTWQPNQPNQQRQAPHPAPANRTIPRPAAPAPAKDDSDEPPF